jgi:hypothetical protein
MCFIDIRWGHTTQLVHSIKWQGELMNKESDRIWMEAVEYLFWHLPGGTAANYDRPPIKDSLCSGHLPKASRKHYHLSHLARSVSSLHLRICCLGAVFNICASCFGSPEFEYWPADLLSVAGIFVFLSTSMQLL